LSTTRRGAAAREERGVESRGTRGTPLSRDLSDGRERPREAEERERAKRGRERLREGERERERERERPRERERERERERSDGRRCRHASQRGDAHRRL